MEPEFWQLLNLSLKNIMTVDNYLTEEKVNELMNNSKRLK